MKIQKIILLYVILGLFLMGSTAAALQAAAPTKETSKQQTNRDSDNEASKNQKEKTVVNTYPLKYISPYKVEEKLGDYIIELTILKKPSRIRVKMKARDVTIFEDLLQDIDYKPETVGKRLKKVGKSISNFTEHLFKKKNRKHTIVFNVFTVIASRKEGKSNIQNMELKDVLEELRRVLNFKSFAMDGTSTLSINETSPYNLLELSSRYPGLKLRLDRLKVKGRQIGYREIEIGSLILREGRKPLISTSTSIQEDGFLVVGITQVGEEEDSLVLILYAQIL